MKKHREIAFEFLYGDVLELNRNTVVRQGQIDGMTTISNVLLKFEPFAI